MNKVLLVCILSVFAALLQTATAGEIRCQGHIFEDDQPQPPTKNEIRAKCGNPDVENADKWVFNRAGKKPKMLHFNDAGELVSIRQGD